MPTLEKHESLTSVAQLKNLTNIQDTHPFYDLLALCSNKNVLSNSTNVELLVHVIENVCKNPKMYKEILNKLSDDEEEKESDKKKSDADSGADEEVKEESSKEEVIHICKYKLNQKAIDSFCQILYSEELSDASISKISFIIGVFCQEQGNLNLFINSMKDIMYNVSLETNKFLGQKLSEFKEIRTNIKSEGQFTDDARELLNQILSKIRNQLPILRIAKIIYYLYDNTVKYLKDKFAYDTRQAKKTKNKKDGDKEGSIQDQSKRSRKGSQSLTDELFQNTKEGIINNLQRIMLDDNLNLFWLNTSEIVELVNDKIGKNWDIQNLFNTRV
mmetsp:Transcript_6114/g.5467  ORF Transcript_6114/g.5467 Transcript_6114/m.5467 type:complete len:330 (+) Transcript_6114:2115-3104(+)